MDYLGLMVPGLFLAVLGVLNQNGKEIKVYIKKKRLQV